MKNSERKDYTIQEFIRHKNYDPKNFLNDIALIKLVKSITFSPYVRPACLHQKKSAKLMGSKVDAIGFGALGYAEDSSNVLMKVRMDVAHPNECKGLLGNSSSQICIKGRPTSGEVHGDTCEGEKISKLFSI